MFLDRPHTPGIGHRQRSHGIHDTPLFSAANFEKLFGTGLGKSGGEFGEIWVLERAREGVWVEVQSNSVGSWQLPQWRLEGAVGRFGIGTVGANDSEHLNHRNPWAIRCPVRAAVRRCGGLKPALSDSLRGSVSNLPSVFPSAAEHYRWALDGAGFDTPPRAASCGERERPARFS